MKKYSEEGFNTAYLHHLKPQKTHWWNIQCVFLLLGCILNKLYNLSIRKGKLYINIV